MPTVTLTLPHHQYDIRIEPGALTQLGPAMQAICPHAKAGLIVDANIETSHGRIAARSLQSAGYAAVVAVMPVGEDHKTLGTVRSLYEVLLDARLERRSPIVAVGGGITGDTGGFVAATYLRGVPFVQCPTTLLAMVDASVGGKVGVNVPQGKNLIGAFYQPRVVVADTDALQTLPPRELRCGLAECVKHGVIRDPDLFAFIEDNVERILALDSDLMVELVRRNVEIKAAVVAEDEKESGVRAHLNFGHTFAHAIEATQGYDHAFHHGEAVALGMVAATRLAVAQGRVDASLLERLIALLDCIGLPTAAPNLPPIDQLIDTMKLDKKVADGRIRLVLPDRLGAVSVVSDTDESAIRETWAAFH